MVLNKISAFTCGRPMNAPTDTQGGVRFEKILRRSTLIYIVALAFIGGLGYLAFELVTGADDWVDQAYNAHIAGDGGLAQAGAIYDRNGTALAQTVDGKRVYNESESVRKSLLHVVGDDSLNISTAVQSMYRSQLIGYNLVFGLNMRNH